MAKPNPFSVTEEPCACGDLERSADDPRSPIVFDAELNEYNLEYTSPCGDGTCAPGKGSLRLYHCPLCGGAAPESKRDLLFAVIPLDEQRRLNGLLAGVRSIEDALRVLGPPDRDDPHGVMVHQAELDGAPPTLQRYRMLTYTGLSDTAEVIVTDYRRDGVHTVLQGKYVGPPRTGI